MKKNILAVISFIMSIIIIIICLPVAASDADTYDDNSTINNQENDTVCTDLDNLNDLNSQTTTYTSENIIVSGSCGSSATWTLYDDNTLIISGSGSLYGYGTYYNLSPWREYRDSIHNVIVEDGITSIGECAFYCCYYIETVVLSDNITTIGSNAFSHCYMLRKINMPSKLTTISSYAFSGCYNLLSVTIPQDVTTIGGSAFSNCQKLIEIFNFSKINITTGSGDNGYVGYYAKVIHNIDEDSIIETIDDNIFAFANDTLFWMGSTAVLSLLMLPENVTYKDIQYSTYEVYPYAMCISNPGYVGYCLESSLYSVYIPDSVTAIGKYAFYNCHNLVQVFLGKNVKNINDSAFYECCKLVEIYNMSKINIIAGDYNNGYIGYYAKTIHYSKDDTSIISIDNEFVMAFIDNKYFIINYLGNETTVTLPLSFVINGSVVSEYGIYTNAFYGYCNVSDFVVPDSVSSVGEYAFANSKIKSIKFGNGITEICDYIFQYCYCLESVIISSSVTKIGDHSFDGCYQLKSITVDSGNIAYSSIDGVLFNKSATELIKYPIGSSKTQYAIPSSVITIGKMAFEGCDNLKIVTIPDSVQYILNYAFRSCETIEKLYIGNGVSEIGSQAFMSLQSLKGVYIHDLAAWCSIKMYDSDGVFSNNASVVGYSAENRLYVNNVEAVNLIIPEGTKSINSYVFANCESIKSVYIPSSVIDIEGGAFQGCKYISNYSVNSNNGNYITVDDVLYSKDLTQLIAYPPLKSTKSYDILKSVVEISSYAFYRCNNLVNVSVPYGVTTIDYYTFYYCYNMESIEIPKTLATIRNAAFGSCSKLKKVYYDGSTQDWNNISIDINNSSISNAEKIRNSSILIDNSKGNIGKTITININIKNNPGITSMKLNLIFDRSVLTLTNVKYNTEIGGQFQQPYSFESPVILNWFNGTENYNEDGIFVTLTFSVSDKAVEGETTTVSVTYDSEDVFDIDENNVSFTTSNGIVTFTNQIPGDINGDTTVNNKDLTRLFQYLSGWDVEVVSESLDVNKDGNINNKDLTRLFQYLSGWDVEIN